MEVIEYLDNNTDESGVVKLFGFILLTYRKSQLTFDFNSIRVLTTTLNKIEYRSSSVTKMRIRYIQ